MREASGPAIEVILRGPEGIHPRGRPVPLQIEVRNAGDADAWMIGVLDGSENGIRYPHYLPTVRRAGVTVARPGAAEDPLVGPLRVADFRRLAPGASFDPTRSEQGARYLPLSTFATWACPEAAAYEYVLSLSTASEVPEQWLGRFGQGENLKEILDLLERVPRVPVTSNTLTVRAG